MNWHDPRSAWNAPAAAELVYVTSQQEEHLTEADHHLGVFERVVAEQEKRVDQIPRDSKEARVALKLLKEFRETLRLGKEHRMLILRELRGEFG
jgi:hypothetical protein